ncbi:hypothetical protein C2E25_08245 [Geothermobacter hydrogeniphilus]|uniref:Plastocyanin-like domain-containing protein n=1 Tax=Geothermobacter hydrogeniphilus TaxID=1969733 RepID=A0A2K2HAF3_9BACT|nr:multicopper oxidase domain-containing protein [Geothermobacter hydrogeniphilus]PNU20286.1 hypothetical protein C2E25_08245 [Geothermobacter hydrogeniphilus]
MHRPTRTNWSRLLLVAGLLLLWVAGTAQAKVTGISGTFFDFTAKTDHISTGEGNSLLIYGYSIAGSRAQYPGPTLIVNQGDTITIRLTNNLPVSTSIIFPGHKAVASGGTAGILTREAAPGGVVTYSFVADQPGTYLYQSGTNPALQMNMGLVGAIIVRPTGFDPAAPTAYGDASTAYDYEVLFLQTDMDSTYNELVEFGRSAEINLNDFHATYWFLNGRNGPDTLLPDNVSWLPTQPYNCLPRIHPGDKILIRWVGASRDAHPLHTHGNNFRLIAKDGRLLSSGSGNGADLAVSDYTQTVNPGETYEGIFTWTGAAMDWDMYGHTAADNITLTDLVNNETGAAGPDGFDDNTYEYVADHEKPMPVTLPGIQELTFSPFYSGSPYLGGGAFLPPGEGGFNQHGGYYYMWHSHNEKELTNNNIFPGGMLTFMIVEPPGVAIQ